MEPLQCFEIKAVLASASERLKPAKDDKRFLAEARAQRDEIARITALRIDFVRTTRDSGSPSVKGPRERRQPPPVDAGFRSRNWEREGSIPSGGAIVSAARLEATVFTGDFPRLCERPALGGPFA